MRTVHRTFAWLLALLVLVSLLCPALAFAAEDPVQGQQSGTEDTDTTDATNPGNSEIPGDTSQIGSDLQKQEDPVLDEKKEAESGDNTTGGSDEKKSQEGSLDKAVGDSGSGGSLSSVDGTQKQSRKSSVMELFISDKGSDETGNGTHGAPFATMNAALAFAGDSDVEIVLSLMTDLCLHETVPVVGNVVTVTGDDGGKKITRSEDFNAHFDPEEEHSTALFEVGTADPEGNPGGSLLIEGIVIDEQFMMTDPLQDAIIEVYDRGKLILGDDAYLLNYGGSSAVHGWPGSEVVVSDGAMILDQTTLEKNGTVAVQHDEGCTYSQGALAIVLSHGETYDEVYGEHNEAGADTDKDKDKKTNTDTGVTDTTVVSTGNEGFGDKDTGNSSSGNDDADSKDTGNDDADSKDTGTDDTDSKDSGDSTGNEDNSDLPDLKIQKKAVSAGGTLAAANDGGEALKEGNDSATGISFSLDAPPSVSQNSTEKTINSYTNYAVGGYEIPYTVTLKLGSFLGTAGAIAAQTLTGADIELQLQLDALLYPETTALGENTVKLDWEYSFMSASATYDSTTSTVNISLNANQDSLTGTENLASLLSNPLNLTVKTIILSNPYPPQNKESVTGTLTVNKITFSTENENMPVSSTPEAKTAITKLLDDSKTATLVYDPNGGTDGPGEQILPAETNHKLETSDVPTHADIYGSEILFYCWTATEKTTYYDHKTKLSESEKLKSVDLVAGNTVRVYAAYSYDRNEDGIPDAEQNLLTLGFDGNAKNVTNVPGPITQTARPLGTAEFDIPEQEPVRKYYTFLGWSEDENATEASYKYDAPKAADRDITISKDTLLYAVWEANPVYTLYFDGNGGTNVPASQSAPSDNGVANLTITKQIPSRTGRTFVGWATQRYGTAAFDPGEAVKLRGGDVTLYAVWERNSSWSGRAPKTGDEGNVPLYVLLAIAGAGGAYAVYRVLKKRGGSR